MSFIKKKSLKFFWYYYVKVYSKKIPKYVNKIFSNCDFSVKIVGLAWCPIFETKLSLWLNYALHWFLTFISIMYYVALGGH
jgi:hypothetical protein